MSSTSFFYLHKKDLVLSCVQGVGNIRCVLGNEYTGAIQVLRNLIGDETFQKSISNVYGSTLLALRVGGLVSNFQKKHCTTLHWPENSDKFNTIDSSINCL